MYIALAHAGDVTGSELVVQIFPSHPREGAEVSGVVRWSDARGMGVELRGTGGVAAIEGLISARRE
jgi:hypothetical protein